MERKVKRDHADCAHPLSIQLGRYELPLFGRPQRGFVQQGVAGKQSHISDGAVFRDVDLDLHRAFNPRLLRDYRVRGLHSPEHPPLREHARQPDDLLRRRGRSRFYNWRWRRRRRRRRHLSRVWRARHTAPSNGQFRSVTERRQQSDIFTSKSIFFMSSQCRKIYVSFGATNLGSGADLRFGFIWTVLGAGPEGTGGGISVDNTHTPPPAPGGTR